MELRGPGNTLVPATTAYNAGDPDRDPHPERAACQLNDLHRDGERRPGLANNTMTPVTWSFTTAAPPPPPPDQGPGGPIAVVTSSGEPVLQVPRRNPADRRAQRVRDHRRQHALGIDLGRLRRRGARQRHRDRGAGHHADHLGQWRRQPDRDAARAATLSSLLGITAASWHHQQRISQGEPGHGARRGHRVGHDPVPRRRRPLRALRGTSVATIYSNATTATTFPAVTLRDVGTNGGQAAAFTFDLPRSIVLTRQGNPAWAGQERDGQSPIRSDDMFFGGTSTDWINLNKVAIPQADEQQRLLANLIQVMNRDKKPLPRFWYFPRSLKAVVIATGDDHGNGGTAGRFDQYQANSPAAARWRTGPASVQLLHVSRDHRCRTPRQSPTPTRASRSVSTRRPVAATTPPSSMPALHQPACAAGSPLCRACRVQRRTGCTARL